MLRAVRITILIALNLLVAYGIYVRMGLPVLLGALALVAVVLLAVDRYLRRSAIIKAAKQGKGRTATR